MVPKFLTDLGFEPENHDALRAAHRDALAGRHHADTIVAEGNARIARSVPVGVSAARARRDGTGTERATLFWDPEFPELGWLALGDGFPPGLWAPFDATNAAAVLAAYLDAPAAADRVELPHELRLMHGFAGDIGLSEIETYDKVVARFEPWFDAGSWWEGCAEDPWPPADRPLSLIARYAVQRDAEARDTRRWRSSTHRTLWSRALSTLEQHPYGLWVMELRYAPVPQGESLAIRQGLYPPRFRDVPVDLLVSPLRGGRIDVPRLREIHAEDPDRWQLVAWLALACTSAEAIEAVRAYGDRPGELAAVAEILANYGVLHVLADLRAVVTDPEVLATLDAALAPQPVEPEEDEEDEDDDDDLELGEEDE